MRSQETRPDGRPKGRSGRGKSEETFLGSGIGGGE